MSLAFTLRAIQDTEFVRIGDIPDLLTNVKRPVPARDENARTEGGMNEGARWANESATIWGGAKFVEWEKGSNYDGAWIGALLDSEHVCGIYKDELGKAIRSGLVKPLDPRAHTPRQLSSIAGDDFRQHENAVITQAHYKQFAESLHFVEVVIEPTPPAIDVAGEKVEDASPDGDDWREQARVIADECFDHDTNGNPPTRDSLARRNGQRQITGGYCFRVMAIMQKRGIKGPRGIMNNPATIMREALQGKKWWANKSK